MTKPDSLVRYALAGIAILLAGAPLPTVAQDRADVGRPDPVAGAISAAEYAGRRAAIAEAMTEDGVFIAFGTAAADQDNLPGGQNPNFRYLTGITEPDAGLIIERKNGRLSEWLFVQARNPAREIWEGTRLGTDGAQALTGVPAFSSERLLAMVDSLVAAHATVYSLTPLLGDGPRGQTFTRDQQHLRAAIINGGQPRVVSLAETIRRLRARKSPAELDMIRRAVHITALAHREAMRSIQPGMNEFEIQAIIEYTFRRYGGERPAFPSIVGSGPNSTTLHYRNADRFMADGELLLMDIGAAYRGYAADVTRTVPVGATFTADQREIHEIVLAAQRAAEDVVKIGSSWGDVSSAASRTVAEGLARLGLIDAPNATYVCASPRTDNRCPQFQLFYMHGVGHGIGLEVHDPDISSYEAFQVGSVFTIEPGIYVRGDALDHLRDDPENHAMVQRLRPALERYRDIGVRIEDSYVITEAGLERLSWAAPREIDEIETIRHEPGIGQLNRDADLVDWYRDTSER